MSFAPTPLADKLGVTGTVNQNWETLFDSLRQARAEKDNFRTLFEKTSSDLQRYVVLTQQLGTTVHRLQSANLALANKAEQLQVGLDSLSQREPVENPDAERAASEIQNLKALLALSESGAKRDQDRVRKFQILFSTTSLQSSAEPQQDFSYFSRMYHEIMRDPDEDPKP